MGADRVMTLAEMQRREAPVQCEVCRWHGVAGDLRWVKVLRQDVQVCPQCECDKRRFLEDGEEPLPLFPMREETKSWLLAAGFCDYGVMKGLRVFMHREMRPQMHVELPPEASVREAAQAIYDAGKRDQAKATIQAIQAVCGSVRHAGEVPEEALCGVLVPAVGVEGADTREGGSGA